jgi:hypothetical protein
MKRSVVVADVSISVRPSENPGMAHAMKHRNARVPDGIHYEPLGME